MLLSYYYIQVYKKIYMLIDKRVKGEALCRGVAGDEKKIKNNMSLAAKLKTQFSLFGGGFILVATVA